MPFAKSPCFVLARYNPKSLGEHPNSWTSSHLRDVRGIEFDPEPYKSSDFAYQPYADIIVRQVQKDVLR